MIFRQALGEVIREQRLARNLSLRDVSRNGYVSLGHISEVERGHNEVSSVILDGIANGLGMKAYELVIEAGYLMAEADVPDTPESLFHHSPLHRERQTL